MTRHLLAIAPLAFATLLGACAAPALDEHPGDGVASTTPTSAASPGTVAPLTVAPPTPVPSTSPSRTIVRVSPPAIDTSSVPASLLAEVVADAAARAGIEAASVTVDRAQAMIWPNSALGCPVPGHDYTDVLVRGYWIVVHAADQQLDYRATERGTFGVCENPPGPG